MWNSFFFRNRSSPHDNRLLTDHWNNSHRFTAGSKTVAVTNGYEAVSALLKCSGRPGQHADHAGSRRWSASRPRTQPDHASLASLLAGKRAVRAMLKYSALLTWAAGDDLWLRQLYTSLELIRSSRVLAVGSAHNMLSVVKAFHLIWKFILTGVCVCTPGQCGARKDCRGFKLTDF